MTGRILLSHMLEPVGGLFFLNCNYDVPNYATNCCYTSEYMRAHITAMIMQSCLQNFCYGGLSSVKFFRYRK